MRQKNNVEGIKIAQAAKDLNVTSVTIRRYLTEFNIATTSDENGIKVLPPQALDELQEIRRLKEEGLTNPKVMEFLEDHRAKGGSGESKPDKARPKGKAKASEEEKVTQSPAAAEQDDEELEEQFTTTKKQNIVRKTAKKGLKPSDDEADQTIAEVEVEAEETEPAQSEEAIGGETRSKHSLTCQTCGKVFEHMNPRLRDCLDCYRAKRKERRRGGSDRHKNVIQHPLAQQAVNKGSLQQQRDAVSHPVPMTPAASPLVPAVPVARETAPLSASLAAPVQRTSVRNYRKAIEETRQITGSLKRRLERPDLPEGERRWLEQIYAYQLILHQGWRHLAEYKTATQQQGKSED